MLVLELENNRKGDFANFSNRLFLQKVSISEIK